MILTETSVLKLMQRIKSFITSKLNTKANSVHTHSISEIDNLASQLGGGTLNQKLMFLKDYLIWSGKNKRLNDRLTVLEELFKQFIAK